MRLSGEASAAVALPRASRMEEKATMLIEGMALLGVLHRGRSSFLIYLLMIYIDTRRTSPPGSVDR